MAETQSSANHSTFDVWPENEHRNYDIMKAGVDGHFRPVQNGGKGKGKSGPYGEEWFRDDIARAMSCKTKDRICQEPSPQQKEKRKGNGKGKDRIHDTAEFVTCESTESAIIDLRETTISGGGGLLGAVHVAYNFDKALTITPDDVLLTLLVGLSTHIGKNPEKYRHALVNFEGKMTIEIDEASPPNSWVQNGVFDRFSEEVRKQVGEAWHDAILCNFSTTTHIEKLISQLGLMEATAEYFNFEVHGLCGIVRITLQGTVEDWRDLRAKVDTFASLGDLDWWLDDVKLVLDQFCLARQGLVSRSFWRRMVKGHHSDKPGLYGAILADEAFLTGWIMALFPYTARGNLITPGRTAQQRAFQENGTCTECGKECVYGETGRGKFFCESCWHAYDLVRWWDNVWVKQNDLHSGMSSARVKWFGFGKYLGDVTISGGPVGPSVPLDCFEGLRVVRGYAMTFVSAEREQSA